MESEEHTPFHLHFGVQTDLRGIEISLLLMVKLLGTLWLDRRAFLADR
jgi:hypothetical protein